MRWLHDFGAASLRRTLIGVHKLHAMLHLAGGAPAFRFTSMSGASKNGTWCGSCVCSQVTQHATHVSSMTGSNLGSEGVPSTASDG